MDAASVLRDGKIPRGRQGSRASRQGVQPDLHLAGTSSEPLPPKLPSLEASSSLDPKGQVQGCSQAEDPTWSSPPPPPPPPLSPSDVSKLALCTPSPARSRSGGQVKWPCKNLSVWMCKKCDEA